MTVPTGFRTDRMGKGIDIPVVSTTKTEVILTMEDPQTSITDRQARITDGQARIIEIHSEKIDALEAQQRKNKMLLDKIFWGIILYLLIYTW